MFTRKVPSLLFFRRQLYWFFIRQIMAVNSVSSGIQAFMAAQRRLNVSAEKIALAPLQGAPVNIVEPLIDLKVAEIQAKAAAKVIETENTTIGALFDIKV